LETPDGSKLLGSIGAIIKDDACLSGYFDEVRAVDAATAELEAI